MPKGETSRPYTSKERKSSTPLAHTLGKALTRKASAAGTPDPRDDVFNKTTGKWVPQPEVTAAKRRKRERGF